MSSAYATYLINLKRANNFIALYEDAALNRGRGRRDTPTTDILRAGVVFLHSTLEEYLRSTILERKLGMLIESKDKFISVMENVSLIGDNRGKTSSQKYKLSELWDIKDQTILNVAKDSLKDKVGYLTFNDYSQIINSIKEINIQFTCNHNSDSLIDNYIKRRHKIVHEADKNPIQGRGNYKSSSINSPTLSSWIITVDRLVKDVESQLPNSSIANNQ